MIKDVISRTLDKISKMEGRELLDAAAIMMCEIEQSIERKRLDFKQSIKQDKKYLKRLSKMMEPVDCVFCVCDKCWDKITNPKNHGKVKDILCKICWTRLLAVDDHYGSNCNISFEPASYEHKK